MDAALQTLANCAAARLREAGLHADKLEGIVPAIPKEYELTLADAIARPVFRFRDHTHSYTLLIPKPKHTAVEHLEHLKHWLNNAPALLEPGAPMQALQEITGLGPLTLRKRYAFERGAALRVHARDLVVFTAASMSRVLENSRWVSNPYELVLQGNLPGDGTTVEIGVQKTALILPRNYRVPTTFTGYCRWRPTATAAPKKPRDIWAKAFVWLTEVSPIRHDIEPELLQAVSLLAAAQFPRNASRKLDMQARIGPRLRQF